MSENIKYETHQIKNPRIPFLFHREIHAKKYITRVNWHENVEFLYCEQGEGYIRCGTARYPIHAGELCAVNADTIHGHASDSGMTLRYLIVDQTFFAENGLPTQGLYFQHMISDPQVCALVEDICKAYASFSQENICAVMDIRFAVLAFLRYLCHHYTIPNDTPVTQTKPYVKKVITYIRGNLHRPVTLDELSAHTGLNKSYLSRQFKAFTGSTIIEYANITRCTEAKRLMRNGYSVSEAAKTCGYENLSHFNKTYKRAMGELPSSARSRGKSSK